MIHEPTDRTEYDVTHIYSAIDDVLMLLMLLTLLRMLMMLMTHPPPLLRPCRVPLDHLLFHLAGDTFHPVQLNDPIINLVRNTSYLLRLCERQCQLLRPLGVSRGGGCFVGS